MGSKFAKFVAACVTDDDDDTAGDHLDEFLSPKKNSSTVNSRKEGQICDGDYNAAAEKLIANLGLPTNQTVIPAAATAAAYTTSDDFASAVARPLLERHVHFADDFPGFNISRGPGGLWAVDSTTTEKLNDLIAANKATQ